MIDDGGYVYPQDTGRCHGNGVFIIAGGKTLLDYFAGQALLYYNTRRKEKHEANPELTPEQIDEVIAEASYLMAEAMIAEKRKREE